MQTAGLYVGLMSGTSLDGIDAVLVDFAGDKPALLASDYAPFPERIRQEALSLHVVGHDELNRSASLANDLARAYAESVERLLAIAALPATAIQAIGCHGQTVRHAPASGYTLQLNNPALLAELSGITVVADFRNRDIAAGGQGAPLVPAFHDAVFRTPTLHRVVLNIGGIANLTDLRPGAATRGFDCGPGNMLLDAWIRLRQGHDFDVDGAWAREGRVLPDLLARLMAHEFFAAEPPKSCGREQFGLRWLNGQLGGDERSVDVQATLLHLTATTIIQAVERWCGVPDQLWLCGGGTHNSRLIEVLREMLAATRIDKTDTLGLPADWVEAVAFAWLARQTLLGLPGNLPEVTGARGPRVLGALYPA